MLEALSALRKDNTGYDIKSLFLGAEGTLGVITAATLKLFPQIRARATALAALPDVRAAVTLLGELRSASGDRVSSFELIPRVAVELTARHIPGVSDPLDKPYDWYVLCELSSSRAAEPLDELLEEALGAALTRGMVLDAALARSERERPRCGSCARAFPRRNAATVRASSTTSRCRSRRWRISSSAPCPGSAATFPTGGWWRTATSATATCTSTSASCPGSDPRRFLARADEVRRAIHDLVREFGGSFSAEHGIGRLKVAELERYASAVELELMRAVKRAFDPHGIMNPGKVLRTS